jgi:hypothetical protein
MDCSLLPVRVTEVGVDVVKMRGEHYGTCALTADGRIDCWGEPTMLATSGRLAHEEIRSVTDAVDIHIGQWHMCWVDRAGAVRCLGEDCNCQLGDGMRGGPGGLGECDRVRPFTPAPGTPPIDLGPVLQLTGAANGPAVLTAEGEILYWGFHLAGMDHTRWCSERPLAISWPGCD